MARKQQKTRRIIGPYSRVFRRGAIGDSIDGRSTLGRFMRDMERQLTEHVGGKPSVTQQLLIQRLVKIHVQLAALDEKVATGTWTDHDARTHAGLQNAYRLTMRELGLAPTPPPQPTLGEYLARSSRAREAAA